MHGNHIKDFKEVSILKPLLKLRTLTLFGNPIARINHFRRYMVFYLPQIHSLDFSLITRQNRHDIPPIGTVVSVNFIKNIVFIIFF